MVTFHRVFAYSDDVYNCSATKTRYNLRTEILLLKTIGKMLEYVTVDGYIVNKVYEQHNPNSLFLITTTNYSPKYSQILLS